MRDDLETEGEETNTCGKLGRFHPFYRPRGRVGYSPTLFLDHGTRRGWGVSVIPRPLSTSGEEPVPIVQETGWAPGPVWTGAKNLTPTGFDPQTAQPVTNRYTDWATRPTRGELNGWMLPITILFCVILLFNFNATCFGLYIESHKKTRLKHRVKFIMQKTLRQPIKLTQENAQFSSLYMYVYI
jgi:hypothetical protein